MPKHNVDKVFLISSFVVALMVLAFVGATCEEEPEAEPSTAMYSNPYENIGCDEVSALLVIPSFVAVVAFFTIRKSRQNDIC
ncbi:hypothetical protein ACFLZS_00075 [Patescibacteria group bacterium]